MKLPSALLLLLLAACSKPAADSQVTAGGGVPVGQLKGVATIQKQMRTRLFDAQSADGLRLSSYVSQQMSIEEYMGAFSAVTGDFANGTPNAVNVLLWDLTLSNLAHDLSGACDAEDDAVNTPIKVANVQPKLQDDLRLALRALCKSGAEAATTERLDGVWSRLLAFDAPDTERDLWTAFVQTSEAAYPDRKAWVRGSLRALLLNPYFLINN